MSNTEIAMNKVKEIYADGCEGLRVTLWEESAPDSESFEEALSEWAIMEGLSASFEMSRNNGTVNLIVEWE